MSDTLRATALLLSVLLWSPVAPSLLSGRTSPEEAGLLYAAALVIALAGCALMSSLIRAYSPEQEPEREPEPESVPEASVQLDIPAPRASQEPAEAHDLRRVEDALAEPVGQAR